MQVYYQCMHCWLLSAISNVGAREKEKDYHSIYLCKYMNVLDSRWARWQVWNARYSTFRWHDPWNTRYQTCQHATSWILYVHLRGCCLMLNLNQLYVGRKVVIVIVIAFKIQLWALFIYGPGEIHQIIINNIHQIIFIIIYKVHHTLLYV